MPDNAVISARPRIHIEGELRSDLNDAVLQAAIQLPMAGQSSAELNLLNWGPPDSGNGDPNFRFEDLTFGNKLEIYMSEEGEEPIFSGEITGIEERYGDGAPHLIILAEDELHRLARQRHSRSFDDMTLDDVVNEIASEAGITADVNVGSATGQWLQLNESNLALLQRLLTPLAIWPRMEEGVLRAKPEETDSDPITVDAGDNALQVRLVADLNRQPKEAKVLGYDYATDEAVEATNVTPAGNPNGSTAADELEELGWEGESVFPQPFAFNQEYADLLAAGRFKFLSGRFLHGDVVCKGIPELRAGKQLDLKGVSNRLKGKYRVAHCSHRFDSHNGYLTRMKVNRSDWEGA